MRNIQLFLRIIKAITGIHRFNSLNSCNHRLSAKQVEKITSGIHLDKIPGIPLNAKLKMQWYMASFIYTCENITRLSGQKPTAKEKYTYLLSGALGAVCDMIIDDIEINRERVKLLKHPMSAFNCKDEAEKLYLNCYHAFFNSLDDEVKERTMYFYELLFDAQLKSKRQFDPNISRKEVDEICKEKCGYSMLFLRALVKGEIHPSEEMAWFEIGAFIQYCNDAQDLYKDLHKHMRTFATVRPDLETIARDTALQMSQAISLFKETPFERKRKDFFLLSLYVMYLAIMGKLQAFQEICDYNFSFELFRSKSNHQIRSKTTPIKLLGYVFPKAFSYQYENTKVPFRFDYQTGKKNECANNFEIQK